MVSVVKEIWFIIKMPTNNHSIMILALIHPTKKYLLNPYGEPNTVLGVGTWWAWPLSSYSPGDFISYHLHHCPLWDNHSGHSCSSQLCYTCSQLRGFELSIPFAWILFQIVTWLLQYIRYSTFSLSLFLDVKCVCVMWMEFFSEFSC